jgi:hypothetical protein
MHAGIGDGSDSDVAVFHRLCELYILELGVWNEIEGAARRSGVSQFGDICHRARTLVDMSRDGVVPDEAWRDLSLSYHQVAPVVARRFIDY